MRRVVVLAILLTAMAAGCGDDDDSTLGGARTFYESLDLSTPDAAAETFVNAFARDDFMTVWLVLDPQAQFAFQQYANFLEHDRLIRVEVVDDLQGQLQEVWAPDNPDRSIDAWYLFDQIMLIADRNDAFVIDLSGTVALGESTSVGDSAEVPAEVDGIPGTVVIRLTGSSSGRWRVHQVVVPGGDEERIPWSVPSTASNQDTFGLLSVVLPGSESEILQVLEAMPEEISGFPRETGADSELILFYGSLNSIGAIRFSPEGRSDPESLAEDLDRLQAESSAIIDFERSQLDVAAGLIWLVGSFTDQGGAGIVHVAVWGEPDGTWAFHVNAESAEMRDALVHAFVATVTAPG
jgi:hypothetical protein